eukprot:3755853-Ditylum_brightwellii.AAC.1
METTCGLASTLRNMNAFELMPENFDLTSYQYVPLSYAWDVKFDGRRRACLVANGKVTIGPPEEDVWSGVVNTESVHTTMFLVMLNGMKILAADISSAYLMADTKEMMHTRLLAICPTYLLPQTVLCLYRTYIDHGWA